MEIITSMIEPKIFKIQTGWTGTNFCCSLDDEDINGVVVATARTLEEMKEEFADALKFHIEGCLANGDSLPDYLIKGDYRLQFELDVPAILRNAETFTTLTAISRLTGINKNQLSHYATGEKRPRPDKRTRIIEALHEIGRRALSIL